MKSNTANQMHKLFHPEGNEPAATPSPLPETGKQVITRNGEVLPMNETETEVFHFGTWKEIQEDQDGELYIMGGLNSIYIDYLTPVQKPTPSANELESSEMQRAIGDEAVGNEREMFTPGAWYFLPENCKAKEALESAAMMKMDNSVLVELNAQLEAAKQREAKLREALERIKNTYDNVEDLAGVIAKEALNQ